MTRSVFLFKKKHTFYMFLFCMRLATWPLWGLASWSQACSLYNIYCKVYQSPLLYYSSFLCVLHLNAVHLLCRTSPLIFDVFPSVLVCNPELFFSQSIYEFRTAVFYCCLSISIKDTFCYQIQIIRTKLK